MVCTPFYLSLQAILLFPSFYDAIPNAYLVRSREHGTSRDSDQVPSKKTRTGACSFEWFSFHSPAVSKDILLVQLVTRWIFQSPGPAKTRRNCLTCLTLDLIYQIKRRSLTQIIASKWRFHFSSSGYADKHE